MSEDLNNSHIVRWRKLEGPRHWRPKEGDALIGTYVGRTLRDGAFGQYEIALFIVLGDGGEKPWMVSGTTLISKLDANGIKHGAIIRVVYHGTANRADGKGTYKLFEVYAQETS